MPVLANSGPGPGEALARGVGSFLDTRRQKKQDDLFEEQLAQKMAIQNAELAQQGIHLLGKNEALPFDVSQGFARQDSQAAMRALPSSLPGLNDPLVQQAGAPSASVPAGGLPPIAAPIPSRAAAGRSNIPGGGGSFLDRITASVNAPARGPRYERGQGYYIDHQPQWNAEDAGTAKLQGQKLFEAQIAAALADAQTGRDVQKAVDISHGTLDDRLALAREQANLSMVARQATPPSYTPFQGTDPATGQPIVRPFNTRTGQFGPVADVAPKIAPAGGMTGGMGSGGIGGLARTSGAITGMGVAHDQMTPFEDAILKGTAKYDGLDYFKGLYAKMYGAEGVVDKAAHAAAFAQLDKKNPALANYLRAAETWALEDSQLSGRASDFRTKMDTFISEIGPNFSPDLIANTQRFRATRLEELQKFQPAMQSMAERIIGRGRGAAAGPAITPRAANDPGGNIHLGGSSGAAPATASTITPAERAALRAKGFTDAQINAKFGTP